MDHFLLIAKLEAYAFDNLSLEFMKNYLENTKEKCKVGTLLVYGEKVTSGVRQGSILDHCFLTSS